MNRLASLVGALVIVVASTGVAGAQDPRMLAMAAQAEASQASQKAAEKLAAQKLELAKTILAERQAAQREPLAPWFTVHWTDRLTQLSVSQLQSLVWAGPSANMAETVASMSASVSAASPDAVSAAAASTGGDLTYTKIDPCRAADTRYSPFGPLANGSVGTRSFVVAGGVADAALFTAQGGRPCDVPFGATSVAVNITVVYTNGPGFLTAYPFGGSSDASIINYPAGDIRANGLTLPICDPAAATCTYDLTIDAPQSGTHVIVDVMGYFAPKLGTRKTFTVESFTGGPTKSTLIPLAGCVNFNGGSVTITVPGPGEILVSAKSVVVVKHVNGQADLVQVGLSATQGDCTLTSPGFTWGNGVYQYIDATQPTPTPGAGITLWQDVALRHAVSSVTGGTYTFYLNGYKEAGGVSTFEWAGLKATFHPQ